MTGYRTFAKLDEYFHCTPSYNLMFMVGVIMSDQGVREHPLIWRPGRVSTKPLGEDEFSVEKGCPLRVVRHVGGS